MRLIGNARPRRRARGFRGACRARTSLGRWPGSLSHRVKSGSPAEPREALGDLTVDSGSGPPGAFSRRRRMDTGLPILCSAPSDWPWKQPVENTHSTSGARNASVDYRAGRD